MLFHAPICALRTYAGQVETHISTVQNALMTDYRPDYAKRLEQARKRRGFASARSAATYFGWNYDSYAQHENGTRGITRAAPKYAKAYRVSEAWLRTGEGSPGSAQLVPLLGNISAGAMLRDDIMDEALGTIEVSDLPDGDWIALRVDGDSMDRISPPGSIIFVDRKDRNLAPNGLYVIDDGEGHATYKRYRTGPPPRFEPVSVNTSIEPIFFENEPTIVGRVRRSLIDF